jgi:c-di-GMP-binding flagellar brake protein YcgR
MNNLDLSAYIRPDQQIRVAIHLPDETFLDFNAVVVKIEGNCLHLESFRSGEKQIAFINKGAIANILTTEAWAFCRGKGKVQYISGRNLTVEIEDPLEIQQRREFFRLDVFLPVSWAVPEDQQLSCVEGIWKARKMLLDNSLPPKLVPFQGSFKVCGWDDKADIEPRRVNMSGGGLRIKLPEELSSGTLINLDIFLPSHPFKAVIAVGSVIRATEVLLNLDTVTSYVTAIKFLHITENDQEKIISYIFNEQRNNLRIQSEK